MNATLAREDLATSRARTRVAMAVSAALHALLLLALFLVRPAAPRASLTEIAWLEPGEAAAEPLGVPLARAGAPARAGEPGDALSEARFRREERPADFEPDPQSDVALDDRLSARLASLQSTAAPPVAQAAGVGVPDGFLGAPAAAVGGGGGGGGPLGLHRGGPGGGGGPGLTLARGGPGVGRALVPAVPAASKPAAWPRRRRAT